MVKSVDHLVNKIKYNLIKNILFIVYIMVLQSNIRLRAAKRTEGQSYVMGGVTYMGSGRKAGTGRSATTRYNLKFLKDMGACCKAFYSVEAMKIRKVLQALVEEDRQLRAALTRSNAQQWGGADATTDFDTVGTFANAAAAEAVTVTKQRYADRANAVARVNAIPTQMELIRAVWVEKHSGNPTVNAGIIPELKGIETNAELLAKFPAV